jgi:hypothetical protein
MHRFKERYPSYPVPCKATIAEVIERLRESGSLYDKNCIGMNDLAVRQRYSTFFVPVPPDIISLQLFTPKVVGV